MNDVGRREWALVALIFPCSFIPAVVGLHRLPALRGGPVIIPPNPLAVIDPLPFALHILGSSILRLVGAVSLLPNLRHNRPALHRMPARLASAAGCVSALTGLWMTVSCAFQEGLQGPRLNGDGLRSASEWTF